MKLNRKKMITGILILCAALVLLLAALLFNFLDLKKQLQMNSTESTMVGNSGVEIYLPDVYYAASGLTMEIYNSQITNQGTHISEYSVLWECEVGKSLERKYQLDAGDDLIGDYDLKVYVYDTDNQLVARKKCTLSIVKARQKDFSILAIGDSLSANGALYARLEEHFDNRMVCNGTRGYEGFLTEARLGFSAADYLSETPYYLEEGESCQPFYNPETGTFDWNYYKEKTGFNPDVVQLFLGTNNLLSGDENAADIIKIVDQIRKDDKNIPIYVVNTIYQSDQNGIGSWKNNDGGLLLGGQYKQERDVATFRLMEYLSEHLNQEKRVYLVPAAISVDSEYVFKTEERTVNPYTDVTESVASDPVHPSSDGYYQIADTIYSTMCGTMKEWK